MRSLTVMNRQFLSLLALSLLIFVSILAPLNAQIISFGSTANKQFQLSNWKSYTSMVSARDVVADTSGRLWVASSGGIYSVDTLTKEYHAFRNTEGLLSLDATCLSFEPVRNQLYVGTFDGYIEILQLDSMTWTHITDIQVASTQYPRRSINRIIFHGDTALIAANFGVVLFDINRQVFIETVDHIGRLQEKTAVFDQLIHNDSLWLATEGGVLVAPLRTATLRLPDVWKTLAIRGLDSLSNVEHLSLSSNGTLYAMTPTRLCQIDQDSVTVLRTQPNTYTYFISMACIDTMLYFCYSDGVYDIHSVFQPYAHPSKLEGLRTIGTGLSQRLVALYVSSGIGILQDSSVRVYLPNSIFSNRARRMVVDNADRLWVATSNQGTEGQGFSEYDGKRWQNMNTTLYPNFYSDAVWRVSLGADSSVWASTWGQGLLRLQSANDTILIQQYTNTNSPLIGISGTPDYIVGGDAVIDHNNNTWIVNFDNTGGNGPSLVRYAADGTWTGFTNDIGASRNYFCSAIDASSTIWIGGPVGLIWFNPNSAGAKWGVINQANSTLPDNDVTALSVDQNGALWIGTSSGGVGVMTFPSTVLRSTPSIPSIARLTLLRDQVINDILVDAQNNKWIATVHGVWVMADDGSDTVAYVNQQRYSDLLSDNILSLAGNLNTGMMYIGTDAGINSVQSLALKPLQDFSLNVYPQPFSPSTDRQLVIDGLSSDAVIHIVTLDGLLVRSIETNSRRAVWDGKDQNGTMVSSGVYIVLSVSQGNVTSAVSKILVKP